MRDSANYYLRLSCLGFTYNPYRVPLGRVSRIELADAEQGYRALDLKDERRYSIGATSDVGSFT